MRSLNIVAAMAIYTNMWKWIQLFLFFLLSFGENGGKMWKRDKYIVQIDMEVGSEKAFSVMFNYVCAMWHLSMLLIAKEKQWRTNCLGV